VKQISKFFSPFVIPAVLSLFMYNTIRAQDPPIQWASYLVFEYNNYGYGGWSGAQAVGQPNVLPPGRLSPDAFRIKEHTGTGKIVLGFYKPVRVSQILIAESFMPGRISKLSVFDTQDREHLIRAKHEEPMDIESRLTVITMEKTPYLVKKVAITVNAQKYPGWQQIDAVGICETPLDYQTLQSMESLHSYKIAEYFATQDPGYLSAIQTIGERIDLDKFFFRGNPVYFLREYAAELNTYPGADSEVHTANWLNGRFSLSSSPPPAEHAGLSGFTTSLSVDGVVLWSAPGANVATSQNNHIYASFYAGNDYAAPRKNLVPGYANKSARQDFYMSNDGRTLLMAIEGPNGFGEQDIYVSFRENGDQWTEPLNLGNTINTAGTEYAPYLTASNGALVYSSNGHENRGDADLYLTSRLDDSWTNWTAPTPVGALLNSTGWDGYLSSMPQSVATGNANDVGRSREPKRLFPQILVCLEAPSAGKTVLSGVVIDRETRDSLSAAINCHALRFGKESITESDISIPRSGAFLLPLDGNFKYMIDIEHKGYVPYGKIVSPEDSAQYEGALWLTAQLVPMKINQVFKVEDLLFVQSKAQILPESLPALQKILKMLRDYPNMHIEIGGHTDNIGGQQANLELSQKRAESVKEYLESQGIEDKRITAVGYGGSQPVAPNYDAEKRKLNRRVEIRILDY
jgi:outer membrane protein OmpA-like peptidoglycan-associated protein